MSDSSLAQLFSLKEAQWGVTPASAMTALRFTGESLGYNISTTSSNEIRSDRQITDLIQTGAEASGGVNMEMSFGTYDEFMEGALGGAFANLDASDDDDGVITAGTTVGNLDFDLDATGNTITLGSSVVHDIVSGQWVKLTGSSGDDGYHLASDVTGQVLTVPSITTTETIESVATIEGAMLRNGVTQHSWTLEKFFSDIAQYISFTGMMVGGMNLSMAVNAILTGDFTFVGKDSAIDGATVGTGTANAATTTDVMNAVSNLGNILEGGVPITGTFIQNLSIGVDAGLRPQGGIGNLGNVAVGLGRINITGDLTAYFENATLYNKYLNNTETSISFRLTDSTGNVYVITLHRVKYSTGEVVAGGVDSDVLINMSYQAIRHATYGCTMQVDKFAA